jgi:hypothetical protein
VVKVDADHIRLVADPTQVQAAKPIALTSLGRDLLRSDEWIEDAIGFAGQPE